MNTIKSPWIFPTLLVLYEMSVYLSNDMFLPALPEMMHDLSLSPAEAQLTIGMWFLGSAITPLFMGALADHYGRRKTLLIGGFLYVVATFICAVAVNKYSLFIPRILQGGMVSSMMVAGYACIHESYEHKEAIRILAIMGSVSVLAPALGPLLGAFVVVFANWRYIFWITGIFSSIILISLYFHMPETLREDQRQALHLKKVIKNYWLILINKKYILLTSVLGLMFIGFMSWMISSPLLIIDSLKYNVVTYGVIQAIVFAAFIMGSHFVNYLLTRHNAYRIVTIGLCITFVSGICLLIISLTPQHLYLFLLAIIAYSFGAALCFSPLNRLIIESTDQPMGARVAMFTTGLMLFGVFGSGITSIFYNGTLFSLAIIIAVGITLACLIFSFKRHV